jgi:hypothetical protein
LEHLYARDSIASANGVTFFWTSRPRTSYGNGSIATSHAIYDNLCFYYVARADSTWIFMRPEPGNAYGAFLNPDFDTLAWIGAMEYEIGAPINHYTLWDSGPSPDQEGATYKIWVRDYEYGRVFMRPRDGFDARWGDNSTAIRVELGDSYRQVQIDGSLGQTVTSVELRGAQGAIMIPTTEADWVCGDANGDGFVSVTDVVYLLNYILCGGEPPDPVGAGNVDKDSLVNMSDVVYLIGYIFEHGPEPCAE